MIKAIKNWLKGQLIFILRGAVPLLVVMIFALFAVTWLPEKFAMKAIWSFVVIVGIYILIRKKKIITINKELNMSIPAHLWLFDENGSPIVGPSLLPTRLGSFEIRSVNHRVWVPENSSTGRLTGTRIHTPLNLHKEFDAATPLLYRAMCEGRTLQKAIFKMYRILDQGIESEYFNMIMENVKITSISPLLHPTGLTSTHLEDIQLRYEKITWKYCDGNIIYTDEWNNWATY